MTNFAYTTSHYYYLFCRPIDGSSSPTSTEKPPPVPSGDRDDEELPSYESAAPPSYTATAQEFEDSMMIDEMLPIGLPPDKTMLSSCTMEELIKFCNSMNIKHAAFTDVKQYVAALQKLYPEDKKKSVEDKLLKLDDHQASLSREEENNVNTLFIQLLNKLQVAPELKKRVQLKYTTQEKIDLLVDSTRF